MKRSQNDKFIKDPNRPSCLAPWHTLTVKWGAKLVPDIIFKDTLVNLTNRKMWKLMQDEVYLNLREAHLRNEPPAGCEGCITKEKSGRSRRQFIWDKLDFDVREASKNLTVDSPPDIRYLDFTVSNKCNLACIHCNSFVSTGWTKDGKKLNREKPEYWEESPIGYHGATPEFLDNLFSVPEWFENLQWVALRGGEPLYDELCKQLLRWFVDAGLSHNISLDISTNATVFDEEFEFLFQQFKHVELLISVEATDELYSIIRGGSYTWEDLNNNIEKFYEIPNVEVVFAVTVMNTNVFNLPAVWDWWNTYHSTRSSISMSNVVGNPQYLNIAHMPDDLKKQALEAIAHIPSEAYWPENSYHGEELEYQTHIESIRNGLKTPSIPMSENYWKHFIKYTADLDRLRDTDTFTLIPEMKNYVKS